MSEGFNNNNNNNIMDIKTPPSSPPPFQEPCKGDEPPALPSATLSTTMKSRSPTRGHIRNVTPSTPIQVDEFIAPNASAVQRGGGAPQVFSAPGRPGCNAPPHPTRASAGVVGHRHPASHHLASDLTPVISNSNTVYAESAGAEPGMPGVSPRRGSAAEGPEERLAGFARGLRQRRSRPPLPKSGLPPAKRSSIEDSEEGLSARGMPPASSNARAILRMHSTGTASSDSLPGSDLGISPSAPSLSGDNDGSGNLLGERLAMPGYRSMYSDDLDESSVDTSNGHAHEAFAVPNSSTEPSIFKARERPLSLAPIELKPDRKYFSFQGTSQYKTAVRSNDEEIAQARRLETIPSPSRRPPASPARTVGGPMASPVREAQPMLCSMAQQHGMSGQQRQYQPMLRNQHGVKEMADSNDLDAIFKGPRNTSDGMHNQNKAFKVVSPYTSAAFATGKGMAEGMVSPMSIDFQQTQQLQQHPLPSHPPGDEEDSDEHLRTAYPVESQWSIPSIRLANQVHQNSSRHANGNGAAGPVGAGGYPLVAGQSYLSGYTYDDDGASLDESYYSFLGEDDDTASLSSRGSIDASARRKRWSWKSPVANKASVPSASKAGAVVANNNVPRAILRSGTSNISDIAENVTPVTLQAIAQSSSFLEKIQNISIENAANDDDRHWLPPSLPRRAETFDYENDPPPILSINTTSRDTVDDDEVDYYQSNGRNSSRQPSSSRRKRQGRGSRRKRKEGAAVEWLQELQIASKLGGGHDGNAVLITEAASSKFLAGSGEGAVPLVQLGRGISSGVVGLHIGQQFDNVPSSSRMASEDITKALGMPHPLCRSSTIEAGPFVHRNKGVALGTNNSIALTSSGSGD